MADTLYFSRDTEVFVKVGSNIWQIPVLDGFSFSQATNTSEITLNEMTDTDGRSRRGRRMFTDSYAPAEWSFSTYARPFASAAPGLGASHGGASSVSGDQHAVEEILWAMAVGDISYSSTDVTDSVATVDGDGSTNLPGVTATNAQESAIALKFPAGASTVILPTTTDGGGSGATIEVTVTRSGSSTNTVLTTTIAHDTNSVIQGGSGYSNSDNLFVSVEKFAEALAGLSGVTATEAEIISVMDNDLTIDILTVANAGDDTATFTGFTRDGTDLDIAFSDSNKTTLGTADIFFVMGAKNADSDKKVYKIADCVVNEANIEFDIDGITTINWSGMGKIITEDSVPTATVYEGVTSTNNFIRNRLTTLAISTADDHLLAGGASADGDSDRETYNVTLTGGSITVTNNITFLTPETLGVVNQPLGHVTGTRSVSGSFTCYLEADTGHSASLFENIIEDTDKIVNEFDLHFKIGGDNATPGLELRMEDCHLEVPTHSVEDVISLETNFHALPSTIDGTDELKIKYRGPTPA